MNPASQLIAQFAKQSDQFEGEVTFISATIVRVKSGSGLVDCKPIDSGLIVGDSVLVRAGVVVAKVPARATVRRYAV